MVVPPLKFLPCIFHPVKKEFLHKLQTVLETTEYINGVQDRTKNEK